MLTNECHECKNDIEFPDHGVGEEIRCPHCGLAVILTSSARTQAPSVGAQPEREGDLPGLPRHWGGQDLAHALGLDEPLAPAAHAAQRRRGAAWQLAFPPSALPVAAVLLVGAALLLLIFWRRGAPRETPATRDQAVTRVEADARAARAPTGLGEAKWLMSPEQVMKAVPGLTKVAADVLREKKAVYDRPAEVVYHFGRDGLLLVAISFEGVSTAAAFDKVQARLAADYGPMPAPAPTPGYTLSSAKKIRHFYIEHGLAHAADAPVEKVFFYLGQAGHPARMLSRKKQ